MGVPFPFQNLTCFGPLLYITACANVATLPPISDVADVDMDDPVERSGLGGGGGGLLYGGGGRCGGDADDDEAGWASEREDGVLGGNSIQSNGGPNTKPKKAKKLPKWGLKSLKSCQNGA